MSGKITLECLIPRCVLKSTCCLVGQPLKDEIFEIFFCRFWSRCKKFGKRSTPLFGWGRIGTSLTLRKLSVCIPAFFPFQNSSIVQRFRVDRARVKYCVLASNQKELGTVTSWVFLSRIWPGQLWRLPHCTAEFRAVCRCLFACLLSDTGQRSVSAGFFLIV